MIRTLTPQEVQARLNNGDDLVLLDVREPEEYAVCRLAEGVLIPLGELSRRTGELQLNPETLVVVYCHHGVRSLSGVQMLQRAGIESAVSLAGGIEAWSLTIDPSVPRY